MSCGLQPRRIVGNDALGSPLGQLPYPTGQVCREPGYGRGAEFSQSGRAVRCSAGSPASWSFLGAVAICRSRLWRCCCGFSSPDSAGWSCFQPWGLFLSVPVVPGHRAPARRLALGVTGRHPGTLPPAGGRQRRQLHAAGRQVLGHADTSASLSLKKSVHPQDSQLPAAAVAPWCAILRKACLWTGSCGLPA